MNSMVHTSACGSSKSKNCDCDCGNVLHGITNIKAPQLFEQKFSLSKYELMQARQASAKFAGNRMPLLAKREFDYIAIVVSKQIIESEYQEDVPCDWGDFSNMLELAHKELVDNLRGKVADKIALRLINKVKDQGARRSLQKQIKLYFEYNHLVCAFCVALLEFYEIIDKGVNEIANNIANSLINEIFKGTEVSEVAKKVVKNIIERTLKKIFKVSTSKIIKTHIPPPWNNEISVRIIGLMSCPEPKEHPEVIQQCLKPLLEGYLKDVIKELLPEDLNALYKLTLKEIGIKSNPMQVTT